MVRDDTIKDVWLRLCPFGGTGVSGAKLPLYAYYRRRIPGEGYCVTASPVAIISLS